MTVCFVLLLAVDVVAASADPANHPQSSWRYSFGEIGYFGGRTDEGLQGSDSGYAVGGGIGWRIQQYLRAEFDALYSSRQYDTPPGIEFADDSMLLTNLMFTVNAQGTIPFWVFEGYAGVGLGFVISELEVPSTLTPLSSAANRSSFDVTAQILLGLDFVFTRKSRIGIEFRNSFATADFGDLSRGGVDIGGKLVILKIKLPF